MLAEWHILLNVNVLLGPLLQCCSCFVKSGRIFVYTHRRMAITADDVSLEAIIPISLDFAVVEGELLLFGFTPFKQSAPVFVMIPDMVVVCPHAFLLLISF